MSMKMVYTDPSEIEYSEIIRQLPGLNERIRECYDRGDFKTPIDISYQIGKLYAPSDDSAGSRIAYLIQQLAGTMYFGGIQHQVDVLAKERMARLESRQSFEPPF